MFLEIVFLLGVAPPLRTRGSISCDIRAVPFTITIFVVLTTPTDTDNAASAGVRTASVGNVPRERRTLGVVTPVGVM